MSWSPQENDAFFGEPQEDTREPGDHADDAATMCVWCEERVCGACKSHYDTLTCTHRVFVPTAEQWDSAVEARAAELHEGCRMPMEQAQELAASEMSEGRKALLAAFGAASAAREQDLRGQYPKAARVLAEEVRRLKAERDALAREAHVWSKAAEAYAEHETDTKRLDWLMANSGLILGHGWWALKTYADTAPDDALGVLDWIDAAMLRSEDADARNEELAARAN